MAVVFPVVFIIAECEISLFLNAEHICQLEEMSVCLMAAGFSHTDNAAAVIYEFLNGRRNYRIAPPLTACLCGIRIAYVDDDINIL